MNILFMPSWYETEEEPNSGNFFTEQAKTIQSMGNDVTIAIVNILNSPYKCSAPKYKIIEEKRHGIKVYRMVVPSLMTGQVPGIFYSYYTFFYKQLFRYMRSRGLVFDVMYAHSFWHAGYIGTVLKKKYHIPLIVQEHRSMLVTGEFSGRYNAYLRKTVLGADAFYCVSNRLRDNVCERTGLKEQIEILPNMVDDLFQYHPLNSTVFTYTFIGTLNDNKRILQLLRCFESVVIKYPETILCVAGDGPLKECVLDTIKRSDVLSSSVKYLGRLSREGIADLLTKTNVLILPSVFETFGVVCIEAMAVGRPVICTRNGALDFVNKSNGILIDADSDSQLISAMEEIYEKYDNYDLKSIAEKCREEYSGSCVMAKVLDRMRACVR